MNAKRRYSWTLFWILLTAPVLMAQANQPGWSASVFIQPFPSPYLADWENNPTIGSLTVNNTMDPPTDIVLELVLRRSNGSVLAIGKSHPIAIPTEVSTQINSDRFIDWNNVTYDASIKDQAIRSGRLPEGEYSVCVTVRNAQILLGPPLVSEVCANFTIVYPDPPILFLPANGDSVATNYPVFSWTPVQVPVHYGLQYVLRVAEILPGQTPRQALQANIPQYLNENLSMTNFQYPLDALSLDPGKLYAWQVQAVDQNGYPPATNEGRSEIWTFVHGGVAVTPPTLPPSAGTITLKIVPNGSATGPFSDFETSSFESVAQRLDAFTSGAALELPVEFSEGFDHIVITTSRASIYIDREKHAIAILGKKTIGGKEFQVLFTRVWRLEQNHARWESALALKAPDFKFRKVKDSFGKEIRLLDVTFTKGMLICAFGDFDVKSADLPASVAHFYGVEKIELKPGLNFLGEFVRGQRPILDRITELLGFTDHSILLKGFLGPHITVEISAQGGSLDTSLTFAEVELSATFLKWERPSWLRLPALPPDGIITNMEAELEIGADIGGETGGAGFQQVTGSAHVQLKITATVEMPFTAEHLKKKIKFYGAVQLEKEWGSGTDTTQDPPELTVELGADDLFRLPMFEDIFKMHSPALKIIFEHVSGRKFQFQSLAISGEFDIDAIENCGEWEVRYYFPKPKGAGPDSTAATTPDSTAATTASTSKSSSKSSPQKNQKKRKKYSSKRGDGLELRLEVDMLALGRINGTRLLRKIFRLSNDALDKAIQELLSLDAFSLKLSQLDKSMIVRVKTSYMNSTTEILASVSKSKDFIFGIKPQNWSLSKALPDLSIPGLSSMSLSNVGLIVTNEDISANSSDLSEEEYEFYRQVYQRDAFDLELSPGLNLIVAVPVGDIASNGPLVPLMDKLGIERGPALLHGALVKEVKDIYFLAELPPMSPQGAPEWFKSGQVALELTGQPSIGLVGSITVDIGGDILTFFVKTKAGKEGLILVGGLDSEEGWHAPLGIEWLTLNRVVLLLGVTPTGSVQMGFEGDLVVGEKDMRTAVLIALNAATGVPTNAMFDGESEDGFGLSDLVILQSKIAAARSGGAGPEPLSLENMPTLDIKKAKLKFAPKDSPELNIERGLTIGGRLLLRANASSPPKMLADALFDVGDNGIIARGEIGKFEIGPVKMDEAKIDLTMTRDDQHFLVAGHADLGFMKSDLDIGFTKTSMLFDAKGKMFNLFETELYAYGKIDFAKPAFEVRAKMKNDFNERMNQLFGEELPPIIASNRNKAKKAADDAEKALDAAEDARKAAFKKWQDTPLLPRDPKVAAREKLEQKAADVAKKRAINIAKQAEFTKWDLAKRALDQQQSGGERLIVVQRAEFEADLASLVGGGVKKLEMDVKIRGKEKHLSLTGWSFKDIKKSMKAGVKQIAQNLADSN